MLRAKRIRVHRQLDKQEPLVAGYRIRLSEVEAAIPALAPELLYLEHCAPQSSAPGGNGGGEPAPMPSVLAQAAAEAGDLRAVVGILGTDPKDRLAAALASLGRAFMARDS